MQMALMENTVQNTLHVPGTVPNQHIPSDTNNQCNTKRRIMVEYIQSFNRNKGNKTVSCKRFNCKHSLLLVAFCWQLIITSTNSITKTRLQKVRKIAYSPRHNESALFPEYWTSFRDWIRVTDTFYSFWQKFAYCVQHAWQAGCEQYRKVVGSNAHTLAYMRDMTKKMLPI